MSGERVHLFDLRLRTSAAGNRYLAGWLGKASVVGFLDREAEGEVWQIFVSTPAPKTDNASRPKPAARSRSNPSRSRSSRQPLPAGVLNDDLSDL